jgi:hypothetical protein
MRIKSILLLVLFISSLVPAQKYYSNPEISSKDIYDHLKYLASDELEGRYTGSKGEKLAYEYIQKQFESYGLKPAFTDGYLQSFSFTDKVELTGSNSVLLSIGDKENRLLIKTDFMTAPFSGTAAIKGDLVFAGYGISAPKLNYDDYSGIDVKGKIVIVLRGNPEYDKNGSPFEMFSSFRQKASVAKEKGAAGIIVVNGFFPKNDEDKLIEFTYDQSPLLKDFSVIQVKRSFIDELFKSEGLNLSDYQLQISKDKKPASFPFKKASANIKTGVTEIMGTGHNVAAILEGNDPLLKSEYIVIGAHYDHLGYGQIGSLYRGPEKLIHNGADDNASGTAGILELAEKLASTKSLKRSVVFVAFSGEELGILGSTYFVNNPPVPLDKTTGMLNLDMIGRLNNDNVLNVIGAGTAQEFKNLLNRRNGYNFSLSMTDDGMGGSDHQAFTNKQIPVLFFFTAMHQDYHKPSDKIEKINSAGEEKVVRFVYDIASSIDSIGSKLQFVQVKTTAQRRPSGGSKVYVGTVPEFGYKGKGFKLSGVSDNSPAQKGGLQAGDVMIKFGPKEVKDIYDYMYAMNNYNPGDTVDVVVLRGDKEMTFKLKLAAK